MKYGILAFVVGLVFVGAIVSGAGADSSCPKWNNDCPPTTTTMPSTTTETTTTETTTTPTVTAPTPTTPTTSTTTDKAPPEAGSTPESKKAAKRAQQAIRSGTAIQAEQLGG